MKEQTNIQDLPRKSKFYFAGDTQREPYWYVKTDGMYAQVVDKKEDMDNSNKWAFVSVNSIVIPA